MASNVNVFMDSFKITFYIALYTYLGYINKVNGYLTEYCSSETFSPHCGQREVIVMTQAVYGRMHRGKCMGSDVGLGCQRDVLQILDEKCSNKNECEFDVHKELHSLNTPCPTDIVRYMEADYACEQVLQIEQSQCRSAAQKMEVSAKVSVSSESLARANCGSSSLGFTARPGQQLNISIIDFNHINHQDNGRSCVNYLELSDIASGNTEPVCAGSYQRSGHVMVSTGHEVTAIFHLQDPRNQRFILSFEAVGCGDITPSEGTWVQRQGDETTLGCHSGRHSWTLTCEHNQWVGAVGSCGTGFTIDKTLPMPEVEKQRWNIAIGMMAFALFSVLLFLCSTSFSIGVCIYTRRNQKDTGEPPHRYHQQTLPLIAHNRPNTPTHMPPNQAMINQQQILQREQHQNECTDSVSKQTARHKENTSDTDPMYFNTMQSQSDSVYSDSVKYYVLESLHEPTPS